ncbi:MAG: 50S ribosomal protein L17 [Candidatus Omnitrophica bacterium]|nr:50S ribosomal protein L17 [Candidatus Omnitrophota bacterium]
MRHKNRKGKLNRRTSWREATLKSLTRDLFKYQRIETTLAKAKALRSYAEPLITIAKKNPESVSARRRIFSKLCSRDVVKMLFDDLAPLYKDIPGGYTRIMALGNRKGDGASMAIMELTKRTISDEDLLGGKAEKLDKKEKIKSKQEKEKEVKAKEEKGPEEKAHVAPEVKTEEKEERAVEDIKREKAKKEQKKVTQKGFFKRFRRKSIG